MNLKRWILVGILLVLLVGTVSASTSTTINCYRDGDLVNNPADAATTFYTIRDGAGTASTDPIAGTSSASLTNFKSTSTSGGFDYIYRDIYSFNTTLPVGSVVVSANVTFWNKSQVLGFDTLNSSLIDAEPADPTDFVAADFNATTFTRMATDSNWVDYTSSNQAITFELNTDGNSHINTTGYTSFIATSAYDVDNTSPTWESTKNQLWGLRSAAYNTATYPIHMHITYDIPPVSNFTYTISGTTSPYTVSFTDTSTNTPTIWQWYWYTNETVSNTTQNPVVSLTAGTYNVRMQASNGVNGSWENTTIYAYPSPPVVSHNDRFYISNLSDGETYRYSEGATLASLITGAGTGAISGATWQEFAGIYSWTTPDTYSSLHRGEIIVNTSSLPDTTTIDSVSFNAWINPITQLGVQDYGITGITPTNSDGTIVAADYQKKTSSRWSTDVTGASINPSSVTTLVGNSLFTSNVSTTGNTSFQVRMVADIDNNDGLLSWQSGADKGSYLGMTMSEDNTYYNPYLDVTWHYTPEQPQVDFFADEVAVNQYFNVTFYDNSLTDQYLPTVYLWEYKLHSDSVWTEFSTSRDANFVFPAGTYDIRETGSNSAGTDTETKDSYIISSTVSKTTPKIYPVPYINETRILPFNYTQYDRYDVPYIFNDTVLGSEGSNLSINGTPNSYEMSSFVIKPSVAGSDFNVTISDLSDGLGHTIPLSNIDIRTIKVWWQADYNDIYTGGTDIYVLAPELLLKDDSVVFINNTSQQNLLRISLNGISQYFHIDNTTSGTFPSDALIYDNATNTNDIKPFIIPENQNKQILLTTFIPLSQVAGNYTGTITISSNSTNTVTLNQSVRVLPFTLQNSTKFQGIYYNSRSPLSSSYSPWRYPLDRTPTQYAAELADIKSHGIDYPTLSGYAFSPSMDTGLQLRAASGLPMDKIYLNSENLISYDPDLRTASSSADLSTLKNNTLWMQNITHTYGFGTNYAYGFEEPTSIQVTNQRIALTTVKNNGSSLWQSSSGEISLPNADLLDSINLAMGVPYPTYNNTLVTLWKSTNPSIKVFVYANPQMGIEDPEIYRYSYGFGLWGSSFDGAFNFAYQQEYGQSIWNDFDGGTAIFRDHVMAYPTSNNIIDTIQWEGYREGVDDSRYADTLSNITGNTTEATTIVNDCISAGSDMSVCRNTIIEHILAYGGAVHPTSAFTCTPLTGIAPLNVTCTDTSTDSPTNWKWAYKNATDTWTNFSTDQNPTTTFTNVGSYSLNLTATNDAGTDDEVKTNYITVTNSMGGLTTPDNPLTGSGITAAIVGALALIGVLLIGAGTLMIVNMFRSGTMGRDDSVATSPSGMGLGIAAITVGALLLVMAYIVINPLFILAGA